MVPGERSNHLVVKFAVGSAKKNPNYTISFFQDRERGQLIKCKANISCLCSYLKEIRHASMHDKR